MNVARCDYLSIIRKVPGYGINHYKITAGEAFPAGDTTAADHAFLSARPRIGVRRRPPSFPWSAGLLSAERRQKGEGPGRSVRSWPGGKFGGNWSGLTARAPECQRAVYHGLPNRAGRHCVPEHAVSTSSPGRRMPVAEQGTSSLSSGGPTGRTECQGGEDRPV